MTVSDVAEIVNTSRFTYTKWERGEITVSANSHATLAALRALERALVAGFDVMLFPEPRVIHRMRILKLLFDAYMVKR